MGRMTPQQKQELYLLARNVVWRYRLDQYEDEAIAGTLAALRQGRDEVLESLDSWFASQFQDERNQALLDEFDRMTEAMRIVMTEDISDISALAGVNALAEHEDILTYGGMLATFNNISLAPEQFRQIMSETPFGGKLLSEWVESAFDVTVREAMQQELRTGALKGEGYRQMVRRLMRGEAWDLLEHEAISLSRTYVQSANVAAQQAVYKANDDIVKGWKWCATLEPGYKSTGRGTCLRCAALDGQEFELDKGPPIPLHVRCRCVSLPVTKTWRELGLDIDEMEDVARPYTQRGNVNIDAGGRRTIEEVGFHNGDYGTWFADQDRAWRVKAAGPGRVELLDSGDIEFHDLVDRGTGRLRTLKELRGGDGPGNKAGAAAAAASSSRKGLDTVGIERYIDEKGVLRDAVRAVVDDRKFRDYALNMESEKGRHKAINMKKVLGYTADDFEELKQQVIANVSRYQAEHHSTNQFGESFTVFMPVVGKQGQKSVVKTGWFFRKGEELPRLSNIFVADSREQEKYKKLLDLP